MFLLSFDSQPQEPGQTSIDLSLCEYIWLLYQETTQRCYVQNVNDIWQHFGNSYLQGVHFWESFWQIKCLVLSSQQCSRILPFVGPSRAVRFCTWDIWVRARYRILIWIWFNWFNIGIISDCRDTIEQRGWKKFEDAFPCLCHLSILRYRPDVK